MLYFIIKKSCASRLGFFDKIRKKGARRLLGVGDDTGRLQNSLRAWGMSSTGLRRRLDVRVAYREVGGRPEGLREGGTERQQVALLTLTLFVVGSCWWVLEAVAPDGLLRPTARELGEAIFLVLVDDRLGIINAASG